MYQVGSRGGASRNHSSKICSCPLSLQVSCPKLLPVGAKPTLPKNDRRYFSKTAFKERKTNKQDGGAGSTMIHLLKDTGTDRVGLGGWMPCLHNWQPSVSMRFASRVERHSEIRFFAQVIGETIDRQQHLLLLSCVLYWRRRWHGTLIFSAVGCFDCVHHFWRHRCLLLCHCRWCFCFQAHSEYNPDGFGREARTGVCIPPSKGCIYAVRAQERMLCWARNLVFCALLLCKASLFFGFKATERCFRAWEQIVVENQVPEKIVNQVHGWMW